MKEKNNREQLHVTYQSNSEVLSQSGLAVAQSIDSDSKKTGRWTMDEHFRFIEAL
jgi:hypothetical protein